MMLPAHIRAKIRQSRLFVVPLTAGWLAQPDGAAKIRSAQELGKPFRVLVFPGAAIPEQFFRGVPDLQVIHVETPQDAARQIQRWLHDEWRTR
jgi:hypothetical protein